VCVPLLGGCSLYSDHHCYYCETYYHVAPLSWPFSLSKLLQGLHHKRGFRKIWSRTFVNCHQINSLLSTFERCQTTIKFWNIFTITNDVLVMWQRNVRWWEFPASRQICPVSDASCSSTSSIRRRLVSTWLIVGSRTPRSQCSNSHRSIVVISLCVFCVFCYNIIDLTTVFMHFIIGRPFHAANDNERWDSRDKRLRFWKQ